MEIRHHGHAFFSLVARDGSKVLIDPFLKATTKKVRDFSPDLILVTHAHADHVGSTVEFGKPILANPELADLLGKAGAAHASGMNIGGATRVGGLRIWMAPAFHSSGWHSTDKGTPQYAGNPCGYVVDDGETRFYHAGDTGLFGDMRAVVRDLLQPHVAAVPIGDHYTMGPEHAARAVEWLGVHTAIPMHYDTFPAIHADPHEFEKRVGTAARVVIPPVDGGVEVKGAMFVRTLVG